MDEAGAFGKVRQTPGEMLLPEPPIGQLDASALFSLPLPELERAARDRGIDPDEIFTEEQQRAFAGQRVQTWTRENALRVALLYLDGRVPSEFIKELNAMLIAQGKPETTADALKVRVGSWLTDVAKAQSVQNRLVRKWHEFLGPGSPETEQELAALEAAASASGTPLKRHQIFVHPADRQSSTRGGRSMARIRHGKTLFSSDVIIKAAYLRFVEKKEPSEVAALIGEKLGEEVTENDVSQIYARSLTDEAQEVFGMRPRAEQKTWRTDEYKRAAALLMAEDDITYDAVAHALGRTVDTTYSGLQYEGKRIMSTHPEYADEPWLLGFLLTHADSSLFPEGEERFAKARRIAALHSRSKTED